MGPYVHGYTITVKCNVLLYFWGPKIITKHKINISNSFDFYDEFMTDIRYFKTFTHVLLLLYFHFYWSHILKSYLNFCSSMTFVVYTALTLVHIILFIQQPVYSSLSYNIYFNRIPVYYHYITTLHTLACTLMLFAHLVRCLTALCCLRTCT